MKKMSLFRVTWLEFRQIKIDFYDSTTYTNYIAANNIFEACSKIDKTVTNIKSFEDIGEVVI